MGKIRFFSIGFSMFLMAFLAIPTISLFPTVSSFDASVLSTLSAKLWHTAVLSAVVGIVATLVGSYFGFVASVFETKFSKFVSLSLLFPLSIPSYMMAIAYSDLGGFVFTEYGYVYVMSLCSSSYAFALVRSTANSVSDEMLWSLLSVGGDRKRILAGIFVPVLKPVFVSSFLIAFADSFGEFGTAAFSGTQTVAPYVYGLWFGGYEFESAKTAATVSILIILAFVGLFACVVGSVPNYKTSLGKFFKERSSKIRPKGWFKWFANVANAIGVSAFFAIPSYVLVKWSVVSFGAFASEELFSVLFGTFKLSAVAVFATMVVAVSAFEADSRLKKAVTSVLRTNYFVSGAFFSIAILSLSGTLGFGTGTFAILALAISLKYASVAFNVLEGKGSQIDGKYEDVCRMFGKSKFWFDKEVKYPLLANALSVGALLAFLEVVKELPLTMALRPFGLETFATKAFHYAVAEMPYMAAPWIICVSIISTSVAYAIITRSFKEEKP